MTERGMRGCSVIVNRLIDNVFWLSCKDERKKRNDRPMFYNLYFKMTGGSMTEGNLAFVSHFQCEAHSGNSGADHKEIEFSNHDNVIYGCKGKENLFSLYILMLLFAAFF